MTSNRARQLATDPAALAATDLGGTAAPSSAAPLIQTIRDLGRSFSEAVNFLLRPLGLSRTDYLLLAICASCVRARKAELARQTGLSDVYAGQVAGNLVAAGLLEWLGKHEWSELRLTFKGRDVLAAAHVALAPLNVPLTTLLDDHHAQLLQQRQRGRCTATLPKPQEPVGPDSPLSVLPLSTRAYNGLRRNGIHTVAALMVIPAADLRAFRDIGDAAFEEITAALDAAGLSPKDPDDAGPRPLIPQPGP